MTNSINPDGFQEDCIDLINAFQTHKTLDFQDFCTEWKQIGFHYIFM